MDDTPASGAGGRSKKSRRPFSLPSSLRKAAASVSAAGSAEAGGCCGGCNFATIFLTVLVAVLLVACPRCTLMGASAPCAVRSGGSSGAASQPLSPPAPAVALSEASAPSAASAAAGLVPHEGWASPGTPGCALRAVVAKPYSLTWHSSPEYWLAAYGDKDYISSRSLPGSGRFFEQGTADFFAAALLDMAVRRAAAGDARPVWFLDVGANIGVHAAAMAAVGVPVLAIEGYPGSAARLSCTKTLNRWDHLVVIPEAIAAQPGRVCFAVRGEDNQGMNWLDDKAASVDKCPAGDVATARGLSDMLEAHGPRTLVPPAIVKVDIEGSELIMLQSFLRHLDGEHAGARDAPLAAWPEGPPGERHKWRPELFVFELRSQLLVAHGGATIQQVVALMHRYGYRGFIASGTEEITHVHAETPDEANKFLDALLTRSQCPNYVFIRKDLDISKYHNAAGCGERR